MSVPCLHDVCVCTPLGFPPRLSLPSHFLYFNCRNLIVDYGLLILRVKMSREAHPCVHNGLE